MGCERGLPGRPGGAPRTQSEDEDVRPPDIDQGNNERVAAGLPTTDDETAPRHHRGQVRQVDDRDQNDRHPRPKQRPDRAMDPQLLAMNQDQRPYDCSAPTRATGCRAQNTMKPPAPLRTRQVWTTPGASSRGQAECATYLPYGLRLGRVWRMIAALPPRLRSSYDWWAGVRCGMWSGESGFVGGAGRCFRRCHGR